MGAKNRFGNIFLRPLSMDETVMCALAECNWYFEDLAFCLFNIYELKDSIFHDTLLIFVYKNHTGYYIASIKRSIVFTSLAVWSHSLSVHNAKKNLLSLVKRIHGVRENTLLFYYLFV